MTAVGRLGGNGIERGIARIVCRTSEPGVVRQSRGFVVDTAASGYDLLLAVAHALPEELDRVAADCAVYGVNGPPVAIVDVVRPSDARGRRDDWAILATAEPLQGDVGRLRLAALAPRSLAALSAEGAPAKLLLYSDRSGFGECRFLGAPWISEAELAAGLFAHSCRSRAGLSGSPILVALAGEPVVIGINVGRGMRPPQVEGPLFYGIAISIDAEITTVVRQAAARVLAVPDRARQARR